jgi:hypothetical protein
LFLIKGEAQESPPLVSGNARAITTSDSSEGCCVRKERRKQTTSEKRADLDGFIHKDIKKPLLQEFRRETLFIYL